MAEEHGTQNEAKRESQWLDDDGKPVEDLAATVAAIRATEGIRGDLADAAKRLPPYRAWATDRNYYFRHNIPGLPEDIRNGRPEITLAQVMSRQREAIVTIATRTPADQAEHQELSNELKTEAAVFDADLAVFREVTDAPLPDWIMPEEIAVTGGHFVRAARQGASATDLKPTAEMLVAQTINEASENGHLRVQGNEIVAKETNEVLVKPIDKEIASAMAARSALETERQNILTEAQTPHEVGLDGALKSYVNGRADAYNNIRNALAESSAVELPKVIEPEEISVVPPTLAIDDRQQSLQLAV
jgi:hypothetical protein